jgi:hypothetical protein
VAKNTSTRRIWTATNGKEPENLDFSTVAAALEKANTYVFECSWKFAEILPRMKNLEARFEEQISLAYQ